MLWSQTWREKLWGTESLTAPFYSRQSLYSSKEFPGALIVSLKKINNNAYLAVLFGYYMG